MDAAITIFRRNAHSQVSKYLDDLLLKHQDPALLARERDTFLSHLDKLGFLVNEKKSELL